MTTIEIKSKRTSKFIREYGMTLNQIAEKCGFNKSYIWILHQRGELHQFIVDQEEKQKASA